MTILEKFFFLCEQTNPDFYWFYPELYWLNGVSEKLVPRFGVG